MPWPRSELTIQASNEFGLDLKVPCPQLLVRKRFIRVTENEVTPIGRWTRGGTTDNFSSKIILATKQDRAIDLSCRACGAGAWALGLDSRWGPPLRSVLHPQPPITLHRLIRLLKIIPAANPTNSSHPGRPSQGCIAQHFVHRSHAWHLQLRNAKKSAGPERCRTPLSFLLKNVIDLERFGPASGPKAFEAISGPGRRTSERNRPVRKDAEFL